MEISNDTERMLEALAQVERAERALAVELAAFNATFSKMHPDDVPRLLRAVAFAAEAVLARIGKTQ